MIDILTNRWGSLSGFQRTRGALRILSHTIKALYREGHASPLIHAGDLPLHDPGVRAEVLRFAGESYKAALNADIIRQNSRARQEDKRRGGEIATLRVTTGLATTAFVSSFSAERVLGASDAQMIVGVGRQDCHAVSWKMCGTQSRTLPSTCAMREVAIGSPRSRT